VVPRGERSSNTPDLLDNLQVWVEHDYDTRLLHSTLAFPLLEELAQFNAPKAKIRFREEIAKRLESGYPSVVNFLYEEDFIYRYLTHEEVFNIILDSDEASTIFELEKLIGEQLIHDCAIIEPNTFTIKNKKVSQINLKGSKSTELLKKIQDFKFLERLILNREEIDNTNEMSRITVSFDLFDETIISSMAKKRHKSKSEAIRFIVTQWIASNSKLLKEQYGIDTEHISKELEIDDIDDYITEKIAELMKFTKTFNSIDIDLLAESLDMSRKRLVEILFKYQDKFDVRLRIEGNQVLKE